MSKVLSRRMFNGPRPTANGTGITAYFDNGQMVPGFADEGLVDFNKIADQFPNLFKEREVPAAPPSDYDTVYNKISGVLSKGLAPARSFEELVAQRQKILGSEDEMGSARNNALMQLGGRIASTPGGLGVGLGAGLQDYSAVMSKAEAEQRASQRAIGASALDALEKQEAERRGVTSKAAEYAFTASEAATKAEREAILKANEDVRKAQVDFIGKAFDVNARQLDATTAHNRNILLEDKRSANDLMRQKQIGAIEAKTKIDTYRLPNGDTFTGYVDYDTGKIINSDTGVIAPEGTKKFEKPSYGGTDTYTTPKGEQFTGTMIDGQLIDVDTKKPAPAGSIKFDSGAKVKFSQQDITVFDKNLPNGFTVVSGAFGSDGLYYVNGKLLDPRVTEFVPGSDIAEVKVLEDGSSYIYYKKGPDAGTTTPIQLSTINPDTGKIEKINYNSPSWLPSNDNAFSIRMEKPPVPADKLGATAKGVLQTDLRQLNTVINGIDLLIPKVAGLTGPLAKAKGWSTTAAAFIPFENLSQLATYLQSEKGAKEWQLLGREYVAARLLSDKSATSEQAAIYEREWIGLPKQFTKNPQAALAQLQQIRVTLANRGSEIVGTLTDSPYNIIDTIPMGNKEQPFNMGDERTYNYVSDLETKGIKGSYEAFYPEKGVPDKIKETVKLTNGAYGLGYYPTITFK